MKPRLVSIPIVLIALQFGLIGWALYLVYGAGNAWLPWNAFTVVVSVLTMPMNFKSLRILRELNGTPTYVYPVRRKS